VICDIGDEKALAEAVGHIRPDGCVHLAGIAFVPKGWTHPNLVQSVNVIGTVNLLEAFRKAAPKARVLVVSTSQVYGNQPRGAPMDEDAPLAPESPYAVSKMAADLMTLLYARRYGMHTMTARPSNHIGPGQSSDFVVPAFAAQVAAIAAGRSEPLMRVGNLESEREFTDVRDVAFAYRLLVEKGRGGFAYNIATDRFVKIGYILDTLCTFAGVKPKLETDPKLFRPTDAPPHLSTRRLIADTGWEPRVTLEQTLQDVLAAM
jgi:GDP-4-dehydro-6-deoxy-D-mannose reductase